jgi:cytochrome c556
MKQKIATIVVTLASSLIALPALAQFAKPEQAIKYRKSTMTIMATHFGRLGAMANGRVPFDAKVAADNAAVVEVMSKLGSVRGRHRFGRHQCQTGNLERKGQVQTKQRNHDG